MSYSINGTPVTLRRMRHNLLPGAPQTAREEQVPGVTVRFAVEGELLGDDLAVEGDLVATGASVAAAMAALHAAIAAQNALRGGGQTHTVAIHGISYTNMRLVELRTTSAVTALKEGTVSVMQKVRWSWRKMS